MFKGRLNWISEKDKGLYNAFNKGIQRATNEVLNYKGAGDWLELNALERIAEVYAQSPSADVVYGMLSVWSEGLKEQISRGGLEHQELLWKHLDCTHQTCFYRKNLHDRYGLYDEKYKIVGDLKFFMIVLQQPDVVYEHLYEVVAHFESGGLSSDCMKMVEEDQAMVDELLAMDCFSLAKRNNLRENMKMRGLYFRFHHPDWLPSWLSLPYDKKSMMAEEVRTFIQKNTITNEQLLHWEGMNHPSWLYFCRGQAQGLNVWLNVINGASSIEELIERIDLCFAPAPAPAQGREIHIIKRSIKNVLPHGLVVIIQHRRGKPL